MCDRDREEKGNGGGDEVLLQCISLGLKWEERGERSRLESTARRANNARVVAMHGDNVGNGRGRVMRHG